MKRSPLAGACLLALSLMMGSGAAYAKTPPDQLIIGMNMNNLLTLDPAAMTGNEVVGIVVNLYDSLVELDPNALTNVRPALATSWDISPDRKTLTFHLRDDVKFHSGNPLTAEDVVWSMRRLLHLNLAQASVWKSYGFSKQNIDSQISAPDAYTVQIVLPKPNDPQLVIYSLGALGNLGVLDSKTVQQHAVNNDWGNRWLTTNEAGSGPFMLETWQAKDVLRMQRNPQYWREEPKMSRVVLRHFQESQTLRLMIEKGDLDVANNMAVEDINALRGAQEAAIPAAAPFASAGSPYGVHGRRQYSGRLQRRSDFRFPAFPAVRQGDGSQGHRQFRLGLHRGLLRGENGLRAAGGHFRFPQGFHHIQTAYVRPVGGACDGAGLARDHRHLHPARHRHQRDRPRLADTACGAGDGSASLR